MCIKHCKRKKQLYYQHMTENHPEYRFPCRICGFQLKTGRQRDAHQDSSLFKTHFTRIVFAA